MEIVFWSQSAGENAGDLHSLCETECFVCRHRLRTEAAAALTTKC